MPATIANQKTMLFYDDVKTLSRETHKNLRLKVSNDANFAAHLHWSPVAGPEFPAASRHYPIVFIRENADASISPILMLGFDAGRNNYVGKDGLWMKDIYIPAFVRRYPFVLAESDQDDDTVVCLDMSYSGFNTEEGEPLFNDDGTNSATLDRAIAFMNDYRAGMKSTMEFVSLLERFDLFEEISLDVRGSTGATLKLENILVVSEHKFAKLFGSQLAQLNTSGFLNWILAHHLSLANLPRLLDLQAAHRDQDNDKTDQDINTTDAAELDAALDTNKETLQ